MVTRLEKEIYPSNIPIKVNKEIFGIKKKEISHIRSGDINLQSIQGSITKSMFPLITMTDEICKAKQGGTLIAFNHALARCMDTNSEEIGLSMSSHWNWTTSQNLQRVHPMPCYLEITWTHDWEQVKETDQVSEALKTGGERKKRPFEPSKKSWPKRYKPSYHGSVVTCENI